jgi:hypothetical protein
MNVISLAPHRYAGLRPKAIAASHAALAFVAKTWVTWTIASIAVGAWAAVVVFAVLSVIKQ